MKKLFVLFLSVAVCSCVSKSTNRSTAALPNPGTWNRPLGKNNVFTKLQKKYSQTASLVQAGPNGNVFFYYLDVVGGDGSSEVATAPEKDLRLNILKCDKLSIVEKAEDCTFEGEVAKTSVPYVFAKSTLEWVLKIRLSKSGSPLSAESKKKLKHFISYGGRGSVSLEDLERYDNSNKAELFVKDVMYKFERSLKVATLEKIKYEDGLEKYSIFLDILRGILENKLEQNIQDRQNTIRRDKEVALNWFETWAPPEGYTYERTDGKGYIYKKTIITYEKQKVVNPDFVYKVQESFFLGFEFVKCSAYIGKRRAADPGLDLQSEEYRDRRQACLHYFKSSLNRFSGEDFDGEIYYNKHLGYDFGIVSSSASGIDSSQKITIALSLFKVLFPNLRIEYKYLNLDGRKDDDYYYVVVEEKK